MKINAYITWHLVTQTVYISDIMHLQKLLRQMVKEEAYLNENLLHVYDH